MSLEEFKKELADSLFGPTPAECCVKCKQPFSDKNVRTTAGWRETKISKMCETCWDDLFSSDE